MKKVAKTRFDILVLSTEDRTCIKRENTGIHAIY